MARTSLKKRLLNSPAAVWMIAWLLWLVVRLIYATQRVQKEFHEASLPVLRGEQPAILCFWHGRMIFQPMLNPSRPMYVLISRHRDGMMISSIMRCFGIRTVTGSSSRGAANAIRTMKEIAANGGNISITPDGPRGPFQRAAEGAAYLASKTGYPIVAVTFSASRHWRLKSWDRFLMPKPFGRVQFKTAPPMHIAADADDATIARATAELEAQLTAITAAADEACGVAA